MTKFLHTCVRVKDLEASLQFYQEALGFKEVRRNDFPEYKFTLVYMQLEDDPDYELELTYNYDHEVYDLGNGYGHIAVGVDDLEATHQAHKEAGYNVTDLSGLGKIMKKKSDYLNSGSFFTYFLLSTFKDDKIWV